jgi:outer membrane receptor protein involved in Fe transport
MGGQSCSAAAAIGLAVCVLCADVSHAWAQAEGVIRGQVVAAADGSAVGAASVALARTDLIRSTTAVADADGRFTLHDVQPGEYVLTVTAAGFSARETRVLIEPREVRSITVSLEVGQLAVNVEVTAEGTLAGTHSPSSTMLTAERLDQMPLAQRTNLPDAIVAAAPGMIRGHDDFVHIRGHEVALNPSINGVQFWENAHAVFSPGLGVDYIDSINVMTGGFSAEYGNRFGGILDVVTKSGFTMGHRGSVTLGTGTAQRHNGSAEFGTQGGRAAFYGTIGGFTSDRFLSPPSPRSIHNTGRGLRSFARVDFRGSDRNQFNLVATGDGVNFELPMEERDEALRPAFRNLQRSRSQSLILSWNHARSSATVMQTSVYQRWSRVHQFPETTDRYGAQTDAERTLATVGAKTGVTRFFGRHTLKAGADLVVLKPREDLFYLSQPWIDFTHLPNVNESHVHFRSPNLGAGIPRPIVFSGEETGGQASLYVQDKLQVTSNLTVDAGVRFDRYSLVLSESHLSPRLNAAYQFSAGTVLFASYNHFFVPPPIENLLVGSAGLTRFISEIARPLPPIRPITEDQFEAGVTQPIAGMASVGVTGYYRTSDDPPHTSIFPDSRFYTYATFDKGKAYGMEVKVSAPRIAGRTLSGYLNYALGRVWFYNPILAGFTTEAGHLTETSRFLAPMDQTHTATAGLTYQHARSGVWGGLSAEYGSGTPGGHGAGDHEHADGEAHEHATGPGLCAARCESRLIPNLSIGWNASSNGAQPRLSLQVNVENLSNKVYLLSKESTMVQGQYSHPRLISASMRFRF